MAALTGGPRWYTHRWNRVGVYRFAATVASALPRPARLALARTLGTLAPLALPAERRVVAASLARMLPHATARQRAAVVTDVFRHFAVCFADLLAANRVAAERAALLAGVHGEAHLHDALADGVGAIVITAHIGNWELGGRLLAERMRRPTTVVVAAEQDPGVGRFLRDAAAPIRFVTRTEPTLAVRLIGALRRNEVVAVQGDRALGDRSDVRVPFFGADVPFPLGPFVLARAARAPIVPAFCVLDRDARYRITVGEALAVKPDGEHAALAKWAATLEHVVRRHPEQWFNFFDLWSGAPAR